MILTDGDGSLDQLDLRAFMLSSFALLILACLLTLNSYIISIAALAPMRRVIFRTLLLASDRYIAGACKKWFFALFHCSPAASITS